MLWQTQASAQFMGVGLAIPGDHPYPSETQSYGGQTMARNEQTSKKAASAASKVLRDPKSSKAAKTAAGSALTQAPDKKGKGKGK